MKFSYILMESALSVEFFKGAREINSNFLYSIQLYCKEQLLHNLYLCLIRPGMKTWPLLPERGQDTVCLNTTPL